MDGLINKVMSFFEVDWSNIKDYGISLGLTFVITYLIIFLIRFLVSQFFKRTHFINEKKEQTIETVIRNTSYYVGWFVIGISAINPFIDLKELLVAGGVIGIVIGFGAQKLIQDIIAGFFFLFEKQFQRGDFVHINGELEGGTVEDLGFRVIKIRLINGKLMTIANGEVRKVENGNAEKRRVFESVLVSFEEDPTRIEELLQLVCDTLNETQADYLKKDKTREYIEPYQLHGLSSLDANLQGFKFSIKATVNDEDYLAAAQQTKRLLAKTLFENQIKMPTQRVTWIQG